MSSATDRRDNIDAPAPGGSLRGPLELALRARDLDLRVACPATVVTYDPATQTAQCVIGFLRVKSTDTGAAGELETPWTPETVSARVAIVQGTTHSDQLPIAPKDTGLLIFADRALDLWYRGGGVPVDPVNGRAHDQADAVFFPGLAHDTARAAPALNPAARTIDAPIIALGGAASEFALRGTAIAAACNVAVPTSIAGVLTLVPAAADPATAVTLANANKAAILALCAALLGGLSTKVQIE